MPDDAIGYLVVNARADSPLVDVTTDGIVPQTLWLRVLAEWGALGPRPGEATTVPRERFLSRLAWLPAACRNAQVGVRWNDFATELIQSRQQDRVCLREATDPNRLLTPPPALESTRFEADLRTFQSRDLTSLFNLAHGANFSVPGAGKTAVTLGLYEIERLAGRVAQLLVVCPMAAFDSWTNEIDRWMQPRPNVQIVDKFIDPDTEILLVNYQRLDSSFDLLTTWLATQPTHLVLDEAHRIKRGWSGQWGTMALRLAHLAARRDVLTGTPAPQHPRDLIALLDFLWPEGGRDLIPKDSLVENPTAESVAGAGEAIRPLFVRTTKAELEIPEPRIAARVVPMGEIQQAIYEALRSRYDSQFSMTQAVQADFARMGRVVMYLLEAATNPALLPAGSSRDDPIEFIHPPLAIKSGSHLANLLAEFTAYESPTKFVELSRLVEQNARLGRKTLVWSSFVRNIEYLANRHLAALEPAMIHGGVPHSNQRGGERSRVDELSRFRTDPNCLVLVANPAALGEGISLHQVCHDAVYLDRTFNAGQYLQSIDRIHRLGLAQDDETNITSILSKGTVDEVVGERLREKTERLQILMDDPGLTRVALPDEDEPANPLEAGLDVAALFAHLRGEES